MTVKKMPLSEAQRLFYLQAMEVPVWVPRKESLIANGENQIQSDANFTEVACNDNDATDIDIAETELSASAEIDQPEPLENQPVVAENQLDENSLYNIELAGDKTLSVDISAKGVSHYLKMVPWARGAQENPAVLIICRHQTDQPAQSFARANAPSQFMSDFILALSEFLNDKPSDFHIRLGHLAQAGLSQDCVELDQVLGKLQPKIVLVLGDETVRELFDGKVDVATLRGRVLKLKETPCVVSYHPYTLIKNPQLKRLAMADLLLCATLL